MSPPGYALRSRPTPQNLQSEATCKDHKPVAAPKLVAGPSTAKLPSPSPENDCNYELKRVAHLTDKRAAYFVDKAFRLLRPRLVPHDHPGGDEEVLIPLREWVDSPLVPMRRKLIRRGLDRTGVPPGSDAPEVLDEIVVGGTKVNQDQVSSSDQENGSKVDQEDGSNGKQARAQAEQPALHVDMSEVDKTMAAGTNLDENDGDDDDSHTEVESEISAADAQSPFKDTAMADRPSSVSESTVANEPVAKEHDTVAAASMADHNSSSDDDELTEVEPEAPVSKGHIANSKSIIEDITMVDAQKIVVQDAILGQETKLYLQAVADHEESFPDAFTAKAAVSEPATTEAMVAKTLIAEKPLEQTTAADIPMTEGYEIVIRGSTVDSDTVSNLQAMAELGEPITKTSISETPATMTITAKETVPEDPMADTQSDSATSQVTAFVAAPPSPAPASSPVVNPAQEPNKPVVFPLHNSQPPLPQSRQARPTRPTRHTRSFRHSLPSQPYLLPRPPRPPPPLFYETAPRLPLTPPPPASPAPTATTDNATTETREYDEITGYEHGDTPETYYLPFPGDSNRMRVYLLRRAENIKRANREARPAWRN
ncbi:hypothetical protein PspLS_01810 [Pyricularia sp. CBS 133598]|nr:hypothetical protein PspLS_01810 [Pyricularia sp. CBS 133598]